MGTYAYRSTTDKLNDAFQHIESSGDRVLDWVHTGGRDWVIIAATEPAQPQVRITGDPADIAAGWKKGFRPGLRSKDRDLPDKKAEPTDG